MLAVIDVLCAAGCLFFAVLCQGLSEAPGWRHTRYMAALAFTGAVYAGCDVFTSGHVPDQLVIWISRVQLAVAGLHGPAWMFYQASQAEHRPGWLERGFAALGGLCFLVSLVPGAALQSTVQHLQLPWLGLTLNNVPPTDLGTVIFGLYCVFLLTVLLRYLLRWRAGAPAAGAHALGLGLIVAAAVNDSLVGAGVYAGPWLLSAGFLAVVGITGGSLFRRFVESAEALDLVTHRLEAQIEERTAQLVKAQEALGRSEVLGAIGQLAAGVAHEINNPAAAVMANLAYLREEFKESPVLPSDAQQCLKESVVSMQRVSLIVRQLLDAGRMAGRAHEVKFAPFALVDAVRLAMAAARAAVKPTVTIETNVGEDLFCLGECTLVEQVLVNLVVNAAQAIVGAKSGGTIRLDAQRVGARVRLMVTDDGPGMPPEVQRRLFEPFFTTKQVGKGTGLGLAVSLGLMRAQRGELSLLATSGAGTTMALELEACERPEPAAEVKANQQALNLSVLLIDDEPSVREALRRLLSRLCQVEVADGVDAALARLAQPGAKFDLVLCDLVMPNGGGPRFAQVLAGKDPGLLSRTVFLTGGAITDAARRFVAEQRNPVLPKPLDLAVFISLARKLVPEAGAVQ